MTGGVGAGPDSTTLGSILQSRRVELGLTLAQASSATRVRVTHLAALESGAVENLPATVYARGYVRTYARYLGLDADEMVAMLPVSTEERRVATFGDSTARSRFVLTTPLAAGLAAAVLAAGITAYAWRQIESVNPRGQALAAVRPLAVPSVSPPPSPSPSPKPIVVGVSVTDTVWINAMVDGKPQYGDSGRMLQPGAVVFFTGFDIKITSGKAAATFITVDSRPLGALGNGVVTREFKAPN